MQSTQKEHVAALTQLSKFTGNYTNFFRNLHFLKGMKGILLNASVLQKMLYALNATAMCNYHLEVKESSKDCAKNSAMTGSMLVSMIIFGSMEKT